MEDERRASLVDRNENSGGAGVARDDGGDVEKGERGGSGNSSGVEVNGNPEAVDG